MTQLPEQLDLAHEKVSILLVDDVQANLLSLRAILENLGLNLVEAHSGEEALQQVQVGEFAVVLLDVRMQGIDGFETAKRIRQSNAFRHTPIIFLTANDIDRPQLEKAYALGAVDFLAKPLQSFILQAKVRGFVELFKEKQRAINEAAQLKLLIQGTTDYAIFMLDPHGVIVTWNAGAERFKGYKANEIIGQHFTKFYPQEAIDRGWPAYELQVATAEGRFEDEGWRVRKDGSQFWANVVITALKDVRGKLIGFSKITRDLTTRKQAEENARRLAEEAAAHKVAHEERERLQVTLASIGDAVIATDAGSRVTFLNGVAQQLTGWSLSEAVGQRLDDIFVILNEQTRQPVENPVEKVLREGVTVGLANHTVLVAKDGVERPIDDSAAPIRDTTGKLVGVVLVFRDVTEQRRSERELRASEARKSAILETALDAIVTMNQEGQVVDFNPAAERMFGLSRESIVGKELAESIIPVPLRNRHRMGLAHFLATGEGPVLGHRLELPALRADGQEFPVELAINRISHDGQPLFTAYLRDITEIKRAERQRDARLAVTHALTVAKDADNGMASVLEAVCSKLGWDVSFYWTSNEENTALVCRQSWHEPSLQKTAFVQTSCSRTFAKGEGLPGRVWSTGKPAWILDIINDTNFPRVESASEVGLHSAFACPIHDGERFLGVIEFFARRIEQPDLSLLEMMGTVAGSVGQFLERRRAEESLLNQTANAEALLRVSNLLAQELDIQNLVQVVTDESTRLCGAQFGAFFYNVIDNKGEAYTLYSLSGVSREAFARFPMPRNTALFGPTFRGEGVVRIDDVTKDPRYGKSDPYYGMPEGHLPVKSYLAVSVISRSGDVIGGLFFGHAESRIFTSLHERLIVGIAGQAAVAIDNARLYQRTQASAERLNLALSASNLGDWNWDYASDIVTLSKRAAEVFGIPPGTSLTWTSLQELLHPDDRDRARKEVERIVAERDQYDIEYRVIQSDGTQTWVGVLGRAIYEADQIVGMHGVLQDISERKRLEESLRSNEERLRMALDAGRMGVWDWHIRTGELKWSDSLEPLHGLAPGTFGGTFEHFQQLIHPEDQLMVNAAIQQALHTGGEFYVEFRNIWQNGGIHWIAGSGKVYSGDDGKPIRMIGIGLDVTQRKRAEQTARFLADASASLAVLVDFDSTFQKVSSLAVPSFADWSTVDLSEADGSLRRVAVSHIDPAKVQLAHEIHRRFPPDPSAPQGVWNILRTGKSEIVPEITDELLVLSIKDAELLDIMRQLGLRSYIGVPLTVRGKNIGVITFIVAESGHSYDQTDLAVAEDLASRAAIAIENAQLYKELREADRRKDEFLATLAHELRNPLAPIRNGLQVLRLTGGGGEMVEEARIMMERQLIQMVRLVDDLLDVSRITRNKLELRKERVSLAAVINSAVETSRPLLEQAGHNFSLTLPSMPVYLEADQTRLAQVFSNLLNNAAKYTKHGGRISLTGEVKGSEVVVALRDNGLGIPSEALPSIFELFSQVDRNMELAQGGLGIGLSLVRRLVEMHNGKVTAYSEGPGRGSEFIVRLPLIAAQEISTAHDETVTVTTKRRILVVDDNQDSATSLGMMLKLMGNEMHIAHDGLAAIEAAETFRPDVILLDIGLPKMNGYDACRTIRKHPWSHGMVIIAITGWGQEADRRRSADAGFDCHLVKPVEVEALAKILSAPVERSLNFGSNYPELRGGQS